MLMGSDFKPVEEVGAKPLKPRPWTILQTAPRMERRVEETLRDAGLTVYVPIEKYRPANSWRARLRPLIPGYIFADLPTDRELDLARENVNVRLMVRNGGPVKVRAIDIGSMILAEACGAFDRTRKQRETRRNRRSGKRGGEPYVSLWKSGERIKIKDGPFAGFFGDILRADRPDRIEVLVTIFGRSTPVALDEDWIEGGNNDNRG
jgi:transcription antitermination factor NusG